MTRRVPVLVAPRVGIIAGCSFRDRRSARLLLADRIANNEAFPGECVARLPLRPRNAEHARALHVLSR